MGAPAPVLLLSVQGGLRRAGVATFAEALAQKGKKQLWTATHRADPQARKKKGLESLVQ